MGIKRARKIHLMDAAVEASIKLVGATPPGKRAPERSTTEPIKKRRKRLEILLEKNFLNL
ncbi:hypothetical protein MKY51_04975 [Solibacillus sp. FSL R5-0691]|uniref:hypothetical protein n=1 Tax=Solibacillus sp. FSL R5-0691 TaxID=2921653 RepID=UPI0030CAB774